MLFQFAISAFLGASHAFVPASVSHRRAFVVPSARDGMKTTQLLAVDIGQCPFTGGVVLPGYPDFQLQEAYADALDELDWDEVKSDLKTLFKTTMDWWPADYVHYGGLFIRLALHCTGWYRMSARRYCGDGGVPRAVFSVVRRQ